MDNSTLWLEDAHKASIRKEELLKPQHGELLVRSRYSFISQGTERLIAGGRVPENLQQQMVVPGMRGSFDFPLTYGYSVVGEIVDGNPALMGKLVHLMHPHASYCLVKESQVYEVPAGGLLRQVLIANMETAINAIWDAEIAIGSKVLVVGLGSVGFLCAALTKAIPGVEICAFDVDDSRLKQAFSLGYETEVNKGRSYDLAIHASSTASGLQTCIDHVGYEGKVIELSWYGDKAVNIHLGADFHSERKRVISSQVSRIPSNMSHRWDFKRRKDLASALAKSIDIPEFEMVSLDSARQWLENQEEFSSPFVAIDYRLS